MHNIINIFKTFFLVFVFFSGCGSKSFNIENTLEYNLKSPQNTFILPVKLHEISGISIIDSVTFACVQDEKGIVYFYNTQTKTIKREIKFSADGDFEDITKVNDTLYILQSDGKLFEIVDFESDNFTVNSYATGIPANNNEGLCYDFEKNRLLIGSKSKIEKNENYKDKRLIYAFDIKTKKLIPDPVYSFDLEYIRKFAKNNNIKLPPKIKKKDGTKVEQQIKMKTSALSIHPVSKKIYLLSASEHLLFIFNLQGKIEKIEQLNTQLFNKAEGIAFSKNGDLFISNEGQDQKPTILHFNYLNPN